MRPLAATVKPHILTAASHGFWTSNENEPRDFDWCIHLGKICKVLPGSCDDVMALPPSYPEQQVEREEIHEDFTITKIGNKVDTISYQI